MSWFTYKIISGDADARAINTGCSILVRLKRPMMPHLASKILTSLDAAMVADMSWPIANSALLVRKTMTIAIRVTGKLHATIEVATDADEAIVTMAAASEPILACLLAERTLLRRVYVPERVVNFIVAKPA